MGVDAREFPGGLLRLDPAFEYVEPPSSWPLPQMEVLPPAPCKLGMLNFHGKSNPTLSSILYYFVYFFRVALNVCSMKNLIMEIFFIFYK